MLHYLAHPPHHAKNLPPPFDAAFCQNPLTTRYVYVCVSEDMPAGQTPHTIIMFAHNDLVDAVQPGDRVTVTGIYRAMPLRANPRQRNVLSVYKTHIDVVHYRKMDAKRLHEADSSDGLVTNLTFRH